MARPIPRPTAQIAPYVEVLGADLAARFILSFGGSEIYLAADPKRQSAVETFIGAERAKALATQPPVKAPFTREQAQAEHRRAHRPGQPGKIETDPELQAFILARVGTLTYAQIVSEVRTTFPPDRHCSMSGLGLGCKSGGQDYRQASGLLGCNRR